MEKKRGKLFLIIIFIILILIAGFAVFEFIAREKPKPLFSQEFSGENFSESQEYKNFETSCKNSGGDVVSSSGGGGGSATCDCYKISEDENEDCTGDYECRYNCDFSPAINSGICVLFFTDKDLSEGTYTYKYECQDNVKGECSQLPLDKKFELNGNELTETGFGDFPQEKGEFSPV
jgi:hypothetical protein